MSEPRTEAGRALLKRLEAVHGHLLDAAIKSDPSVRFDWADVLGDRPIDIVAQGLPGVEAEARATVLAELRAKVEELWQATVSGDHGWVKRAAVLALLDES